MKPGQPVLHAILTGGLLLVGGCGIQMIGENAGGSTQDLNAVDKPSEPQSDPNVFLLGIYGQPAASFGALSGWKSVGVNSAFWYPEAGDAQSFEAWVKAVEASGLKIVTQFPRAVDPALYKTRASFAGVINMPVVNGVPLGNQVDVVSGGQPAIAAADLMPNYQALKSLFPKIPVLMSVSGFRLITQQVPGSWYQEAFKASDAVVSDFYPIAGNDRADWIDLLMAPKYVDADGLKKTEGLVLERARTLSSGKMQMGLIEVSDQDAHYFVGDNPGVTADEFRGQVWEAILRGANALVYYPYRLAQDSSGSGFRYDNISAEVRAEMATLNAQITAQAKMLLSPGQMLSGLPKPFLGATRSYNGSTYTLILNFSHQAQVYNGQNFKAYELKISSSTP